MKPIRRFFQVLLIIIVIVLAGGYWLYFDATHKPLPQHDGTLTFEQLNDSVEVLRDEYGIPHIYASNTYDLFFAQGYTQAQDRWWQMEFSRHTGSGRLSELIGYNEDVLGIDVFIRTLGWRQAAQRDYASMDDETKAVLNAFADGVNAYISEREPSELALEYTILDLTGINFEIELWTPIDSIVWGKVMAWDLGANRGQELSRVRMMDDGLSQEMIEDYYPDFPFDERPTVLRDGEIPFVEEIARSITTSQETVQKPNINTTTTALAGGVPYDVNIAFGYGRSVGSNNWVVSGDLTESGYPLLADDMHLSVGIPALWYEVGLHCQPVGEDCPYNVRGFALSPVPAIIVGHNERIAWGVTNVGGDVQDLYQIAVSEDDPLTYTWNDETRDIIAREETILFGDDTEPLTFTVRETHYGSIVNDNSLDDGQLSGFNTENPMALHWVATAEISTLFEAVVQLNRAQNWDEFRQALSYWDVPSQNFVYADVDGNIGYQMPGKMPIRQGNHDGFTPVDGSTDEYDWMGYIPYERMPYTFNPERGYIASANQVSPPLSYFEALEKELGGNVNVRFQTDVAFAYRGEMINRLIEAYAPHNQETFARIHGDNTSISAELLMPFILDVDYGNDDLNGVRDWMSEWDMSFDADSSHAVFYGYLWSELVHDIYRDQLPEAQSLSGGSRTQWSVYQLMNEPDNVWWDDNTTETIEARDDIIRQSFESALSKGRASFGEDYRQWVWNEAHTVTLYHNPLGVSGVDLIENIFNSQTLPNMGTDGSINNMRWSVEDSTFDTDGSVVSMRMIADLSDFSQSLSVIPTGQSGHPFSDNYSDQIEMWTNIEYHPMNWGYNTVNEAAQHRLELLPAN